MDYTLADLTKAISMIKNVEKKDKYEISFTKEDDGYWYVDFPDWPFSHHNLMMVDGSDDLCEMFSYDGKHTEIEVYIDPKPAQLREFDGTYFNATRIRHSLLGGASYSPHFKGAKKLPNGTFWICPVTLFVLGEYPEFFWIHPLKLSRDRYLGLGLPPANPFYKDNK